MIGPDSRRAIVTGAGRGLGASFCRELARLGFDVWGLDRDEMGLDAVGAECEALGAHFSAVEVDLSDGSERMRAFTALPTAEIAVANAGIVEVTPALQMTAAQLTHLLNVNTVATFEFVREYAAAMIRANLSGRALIIASTSALRTFPRLAGYVASKHAVRGIALALEEELSGSTVSITTAYPAGIATGIWGTPPERWRGMDPGEVARCLLAPLMVVAPSVRLTELHLHPTQESDVHEDPSHD